MVEKIGVGMKLSIPFGRTLAVAAVLASAVVVPMASAPSPVAAAGCTWCAGGEFHALTPTRILETRDNPAAVPPIVPINDTDLPGIKPLTPGNGVTFDVQVLGLAGVPASSSDVLAVAATITVVNPTQPGYLGAYASGSPSVNSVLNFRAGQNVPNLAILRPGANGKVTILLHDDATSAGTVHVLIDVSGWWSTSAYAATGTVDDGDERGARLEAPATPGRIIDTRTPSSPVGPGGDLAVTVRGAKILNTQTVIVPDDPNVVGVLINVTAVGPTATTYLSVVPDATTPGSPPTTSNLNLVTGQTKANTVLVPVGADGKIHVYNANGNVQVLVDVMGVLVNGRTETTRLGRVVPLTSPFRALDTRKAQWGAVPLGPGQAEDWSFASFANSVVISTVAVGKQGALLGNLTNASLTRQYPTVGVDPSYLTVCPGTCPVNGQGFPTYSNLNSTETGPVPNMTLVPYGTNYAVRVFNQRGYAHYILDVSAVVLAD